MPNTFTVTGTAVTEESESSVIDILAAASSPKRIRTEEGSIENRSIDDLIKANEYINGTLAPNAVPWGLRIAKAKPGNSLG